MKKKIKNKMKICELSNYTDDELNGQSTLYDYSIIIHKNKFDAFDFDYDDPDEVCVCITKKYTHRHGIVWGGHKRYCDGKLIYSGNFRKGKEEGPFYCNLLEKIEFYRSGKLIKIVDANGNNENENENENEIKIEKKDNDKLSNLPDCAVRNILSEKRKDGENVATAIKSLMEIMSKMPLSYFKEKRKQVFGLD